ncbi:MAG: M14 family zinc carboxypeptidase [Acidobacteriota bacterium]
MRQTSIRFLALIWLTLPLAAQEIPVPQDFLGFPVGTDRRLPEWQQVERYFRALGDSSDRVLVQELGQSTNGNPFLLVLISHPDSLAQLDHLQGLQQQLADPRQLDGPVEDLIPEAKTVVLATCAIHPNEVGSVQTAMTLAYDLARKTDPETEEVLRNVIFLLVPSVNPDGMDIVSRWYQRTLGTAAEGTLPPELHHPYSGHDNNRDWYMFTQKETRLIIEEVHNVWHPQIVVDLHEMSPYGARMFVPPFAEPVDPNVDPLLLERIDVLGTSLLSTLTEAGKQGVVTRAIYDAYTPARAYQHYHAGARILLESASVRLATPLYIQSNQLVSGRGYDARRPSGNFPSPWKGGQWTVGDIVEYQQLAVQGVLRHASRHREDWLENFYRIGVRAIQRTTPYAFVLPPDQHDSQSLHDLLELLDTGMVEIHRAVDPFQVTSSQPTFTSPGSEGPQRFPAGSYVILMQQPYSSFAKTLLEVQHYPELRRYPGGPLKRPYDVTAHTLGIQLGLDVYQVDHPFQATLDRIETLTPVSGEIRGAGSYWLFSHSSNAFARLSNRLLKAGMPVYWAPNGFRAEGEGFPVGTMMTRFQGNVPLFQELLEDIPLEVRRVDQWPALAWQRIRMPRIGLYKSHRPASDEGWTRWILEQYEFTYHSLTDRDIGEGDLSAYDVIVIPHQALQTLEHGLSEPYPEEFRGGLGSRGIARLKAYAESGGTLLFLGNATELPILRWELGARNVPRRLPSEQIYVPGSLLRVGVNKSHPIGYGMKEEIGVMFRHSPSLDLTQGLAIAHYSDQNLLLSGWLDGEQALVKKAALAEFKTGKGRMILIPFRTQFRAQSRGTYKFLFNSLYYATTRR